MTGSRAGSRTLTRGLAVLSAIGDRREGATVAEVCHATGLDRAVVYRLLEALRAAGYVERDGDTRRFRLSVALIELGGRASHQLEVRRAAFGALRMLQEGTREGTCLAVRHHQDVVIVDRVEAAGRGGRPTLPVGSRVPLWRLAHGRAVLAFLPDAELDGMPLGSSTRAELAELRRRGFGFADGDLEPGVNEVAAPLIDRRGMAVASLGIVAPAGRLPNPASLGARVRLVAGEVSRRLGWGGAAADAGTQGAGVLPQPEGS